MITYEIADFIIDRIRAEATDDKDAKLRLAEYANNEFGIKLKRSQTFPNMLKCLEAELKKLRKAGKTQAVKHDFSKAEIGTGSLIKDLLTDDAGENDRTQTTNEIATDVHLEEEELSILPKGNTSDNIHTLPGVDLTNLVNTGHYPISSQATNAPVVSSTIKDHREQAEPFKLSAGFVPRFSLLGAKPGYYTIQPEISDWIEQNPDWKLRPDDIGYKYSDILKTYIYYINKDGRIVLQEARNQRFIVLR